MDQIKLKLFTVAWFRQIACLGVVLLIGPFNLHAFTSANADAMAQAHTAAFYHVQDGKAWFAKSTEGGTADFWMWAEQMEMVLDVYERNHNPDQLVLFSNLFNGFLADHGRTWETNDYNDDIMWMVIACTRAHLLTGNPDFLTVAKTNFDLCYARAASPDLGGGLWWKVDVHSKNACVNGPGAIAAYLLGRATDRPAYLAIATNIFRWERDTLFDARTGQVYDNIHANGRIGRFSLTYNQGTFVGAANFLGYTNEALLAAMFTMNELCHDGMLPPAGEDGDGGGFNGIAARWIARFMKDRGEQSVFESWLQKNAEAAWQARRRYDNLSWCRWPQPTPPGPRRSWACSSAVVLMQVAAPMAATNSPAMKWADHSRLGRPFSKDPSVIRFGDRYLMYFSLPPFDPALAPSNAPAGWSIGIAESSDLKAWNKIGELWPQQACEAKGLCAPGAIVLNGKVHLFYQTYGHWTNDAICHAVSDDGVHFVRDASNPVFHPAGAWTAGRAIDAEVFPVGEKLMLFYATRDPQMQTQMVSVAGADLKSDFSRGTWHQLADGPVLRPELAWERRCIEAPTICRHGDRLFMFYAGGYNNEPQQIGVAASTNGLNWQRVYAEPLLANGSPGEWNASESGHPGVFVDRDGQTWLFYQGNADKGRTWQLSRVPIQWDDGVPQVAAEP